MSHYDMECGVDYVNSATGITPPLSAEKMCELLTKMQVSLGLCLCLSVSLGF